MKICIERTDRMGDMILTLPIIQGIKELNPQFEIHVIASKKNIKICNRFNGINKIYEQPTSIVRFYNLYKLINYEKYDYYFVFSPSWFGLLLGLFSKCKTKAALILQSRYKSNFFSKFWKILFCKIFFTHSKIVNRFKAIQNNQNIHQTRMMMDLVLNSGIGLTKDTKIGSIFPTTFKVKKTRPICLIHLSSKWINRHNSEEQFIEFLKSLNQKDYTFYLTTDETTKIKFSKIFNKYLICYDWQNLIKYHDKIIICDDFKFDEWVSLINQADIVITPECGCVHISSLNNSKLCIIYQNKISKKHYEEYTPWKKDFLGLETDDNQLNSKLLNFIQ